MIDSDLIQTIEKRLKAVSTMQESPTVQANLARVDRIAIDRFVVHHRETLRRFAADMDPRLDAPIQTIMFHMFVVGALAAREDERRA